MTVLDKSIQQLSNGSVVTLDNGEHIFKLGSFEGNPIIKPQDIGLTWYEDDELKIGAAFNGGAEVFQDRVILMPRCHKGYREGKFIDPGTGVERICLENYVSEIWPLVSEDGINFNRFQNSVIRGDGADHQDFIYGIEDIRIIKYDQRYLLIGCGKTGPAFRAANADKIAVYSTNDFVNITYHGIIESFDSRNAVPFPELINGQQYMLLRFHPDICLVIYTGAGDKYIILLSCNLENLLNYLWEYCKYDA